MIVELTATLTVAVVTTVFLRVGRKRRQLSAAEGREVRPFYSIPGPRGWPIIGTALDFMPGGKYDGKIHQCLCDYAAEYGPIVRTETPADRTLFITSAELVEELLTNDEKYPALFFTVNEPTLHLRRVRNDPHGLTTSTGPEWKKIRGSWNQSLMKTSKVYARLPQLNEIVTEFIERVQRIRNKRSCLEDLNMELFRWSLESIGEFLFESRFGCLSRGGNKKADKLIRAIKTLFACNEQLTFQSVLFVRLFKPIVYRAFHEAWETIVSHSKTLIDAKTEEIARDMMEGVEPTGFVSSVIASGKLTSGQILVSVCELITAAVDTTSNTFAMLLYELSRNTRVQQNLYDEIMEVTGGAHPNADHLRKMDYMKATIKEAERLYPIGLGSSRVTSQDRVLGGYHIPAGAEIFISSYANGRDPKLFDSPLEMRPERWLHGAPINTQIISAFGVGVRPCIGQKTAEAEMCVLLVRLMQRFEVKYSSEKEAEIVTNTMINVKDPLQISFIDRQ